MQQVVINTFEKWWNKQARNKTEKETAWEAYVQAIKTFAPSTFDPCSLTKEHPLSKYPFEQMQPGICWNVPAHINMETARWALRKFREQTNCKGKWRVSIKRNKIYRLQ